MLAYDNETDRKTAFGQLFSDNYPKLYFYVLNIIDDSEAAEDVVEDVFAQLWRQIDTVDTSDKPVVSFLYTLARNKALDHLRHVNVRSKYVDAMLCAAPVDEDLPTLHQERIDRIMEAIQQLPEQTQRVFRACFIEGRKYKEVGDELGISVNTVKTYITRSLTFIREKIRN